MSILTEIVKNKREEIENLKNDRNLEELKRMIINTSPVRDFKSAISKGDQINLIAEIKRRSPGAGIIRKDLDPANISRIYEGNGAKAISVLSDGKYFSGSLEDLKIAKETTTLPILRKDFIIDPYQIYESRTWGADAVLLIASILNSEELKEFISLSDNLGMASLVEVHNGEELDRVLGTSCQIVGINNRDLNDFSCDLNVSLNLAQKVPPDKIKVSESGIQNAHHVQQLKRAGIDAILVGQILLQSPDVGEKIKELIV